MRRRVNQTGAATMSASITGQVSDGLSHTLTASPAWRLRIDLAEGRCSRRTAAAGPSDEWPCWEQLLGRPSLRTPPFLSEQKIAAFFEIRFFAKKNGSCF